MKIRIFLISIIVLLFFQSCNSDDTMEETEEYPRNVEIGLESLTANSATIKWIESD
tara:strand:- start:38 stop:205 length:168 start_codon:yes stop_codon:yes gene_type:complete